MTLHVLAIPLWAEHDSRPAPALCFFERQLLGGCSSRGPSTCCWQRWKNKETVRFLSVITSNIFLYCDIISLLPLLNSILSMIYIHLAHPFTKTCQNILQNCKQGPSPKEALTTRLQGHCYLACPGSDKEVPRIQAMSVLCRETRNFLLKVCFFDTLIFMFKKNSLKKPSQKACNHMQSFKEHIPAHILVFLFLHDLWCAVRPWANFTFSTSFSHEFLHDIYGTV